MTGDIEIAICGAGPVGLALAALLVKRGVAGAKIVLVDGKTLARASQDPRAIALSYGSRQIFEEIGAWPIPATPIKQIHVSRRGQFGRTLIDCAEHRLPALGYVAHYGAIVAMLSARCEQGGVAMMRPAQLRSHAENANDVTMHILDERQGVQPERVLTAKLMVRAEGGVFSEQGSKALHRDYAQTAIISQVRVGAPMPHRAFERFTDEGPLALLPQDDDAYALVWCTAPARAQGLLGLSESAFLAELGAAFGSRLGRFCSATPRVAYPLGLNAHADTSARGIAIGNAAQTLHPVAGQGLNLGLRDAAVLARFLAQEISPASLQAFRQAQRQDRDLTVRLTDTMARIFSSAPQGSISQTLLGASLGLIDAAAPAKQLLAELMMFGRR